MRVSIRWCKRYPPSKAGFTKQQYLFDEPTLLNRGSVSIEQGLIVEQTLLVRQMNRISGRQLQVLRFRLQAGEYSRSCRQRPVAASA